MLAELEQATKRDLDPDLDLPTTQDLDPEQQCGGHQQGGYPPGGGGGGLGLGLATGGPWLIPEEERPGGLVALPVVLREEEARRAEAEAEEEEEESGDRLTLGSRGTGLCSEETGAGGGCSLSKGGPEVTGAVGAATQSQGGGARSEAVTASRSAAAVAADSVTVTPLASPPWSSPGSALMDDGTCDGILPPSASSGGRSRGGGRGRRGRGRGRGRSDSPHSGRCGGGGRGRGRRSNPQDSNLRASSQSRRLPGGEQAPPALGGWAEGQAPLAPLASLDWETPIFWGLDVSGPTATTPTPLLGGSLGAGGAGQGLWGLDISGPSAAPIPLLGGTPSGAAGGPVGPALWGGADALRPSATCLGSLAAAGRPGPALRGLDVSGPSIASLGLHVAAGRAGQGLWGAGDTSGAASHSFTRCTPHSGLGPVWNALQLGGGGQQSGTMLQQHLGRGPAGVAALQLSGGGSGGASGTAAALQLGVRRPPSPLPLGHCREPPLSLHHSGGRSGASSPTLSLPGHYPQKCGGMSGTALLSLPPPLPLGVRVEPPAVTPDLPLGVRVARVKAEVLEATLSPAGPVGMLGAPPVVTPDLDRELHSLLSEACTSAWA